MGKLLFSLQALLLACSGAFGQSAPTNPTMTYGMVPTVGQWNNWFQQKQDVLGFTPLNRGGDVMFGPLATTASTTSRAGFSVSPGIAPTSPVDGNIWLTGAGLFYRVGGLTVGPVPGPGTGSFAATAPLAVSFPSGVTTYGLTSDSSLSVTGGALGLNLGHANTWTALQTFPSSVAINGSTSGTTTLQAASVASGTLNLPATSDTLVARATTDTLSNKTLASPTVTGTLGGTGVVPNAALANQSVSVSGTTCTLGSSCSPTASAIAVGTTSITGGTNGQYLYRSSGVLGSAQAYNFSNILGTVSQSAGTPTGAIIETGSNANGIYTKFADGTMICTIFIDATAQSWTSASGALFVSTASGIWTYPVAFSTLNNVFGTAFRGDATISGVYVSSSSNSSVNYYGWASVSLNSSSAKSISLLAIGRWF